MFCFVTVFPSAFSNAILQNVHKNGEMETSPSFHQSVVIMLQLISCWVGRFPPKQRAAWASRYEANERHSAGCQTFALQDVNCGTFFIGTRPLVGASCCRAR